LKKKKFTLESDGEEINHSEIVVCAQNELGQYMSQPLECAGDTPTANDSRLMKLWLLLSVLPLLIFEKREEKFYEQTCSSRAE